MDLNDELKDLENRIYNSDNSYDSYKKVDYSPEEYNSYTGNKTSEPVEDVVEDVNHKAQESLDETPSIKYRSQFSELKDDSDFTDTYQEKKDEISRKSDITRNKKKSPFQKTIIIAACILLAAIIGFFVYYAFFAHSIIGDWDYTGSDGFDYHYRFNSDGTVNMSLGSVEFTGQYATQKNEADGTMGLTVNLYYGEIGGEGLTYDVSGSKILGNQVLKITGTDSEKVLNQSSKVDFKKMLNVPEDNKIDDTIVGEWEYTFEDYGGITYKFIFNKDGTMQINQYDSIIYNCVYSADGSNITCTFMTTEETTQEIPYSCDGTTLEIMGLQCTRAGKATANQAQ